MRTASIIFGFLMVVTYACGLTAMYVIVAIAWLIAGCLWMLAALVRPLSEGGSRASDVERSVRVARTRRRMRNRSVTIVQINGQTVIVDGSGVSAVTVESPLSATREAEKTTERRPTQGTARGASQTPPARSQRPSDSTDTRATSRTASSDPS